MTRGYIEVTYLPLKHGVECSRCGASLDARVSVAVDEVTGDVTCSDTCAVEVVAERRRADDERDGIAPLVKEMAS